MPHNPDVPCSSCGKLLWRSSTSSASPVCRGCRAVLRCGTANGYRKGCRCAKCLAANAERAKARRLARKVSGRGYARPSVLSICEHCGRDFNARRDALKAGRGRFCSLDCANVALNKRSVRVGERDRFRISDAVRQEVYERDGWSCQVCFGLVDSSASSNSDWFPSLDHVVPRSLGGSDEVENLRTAHRWCNSVLSDGSYYSDGDLR